MTCHYFFHAYLHIMIDALRSVMFEIEVDKCEVDLVPLVHYYVQGEVLV